MFGLSSAAKLFGGGEASTRPAKRKPARCRLGIEALEERSLMSANVLQINLVSDLPGVAVFQDPNLINPWGISQGPGPLWIANNNSGTSTIYNGQGVAVSPLNPNGAALIVSIPTPGDPTGHSGTPDGTVFNPTFQNANPAFLITDGTHTAPAIFLFATEDGTIVGWNPGVNPAGSDPSQAGTFGTIAVDNSGNNFTEADPLKRTGAVYKGLTLATNSAGQTFLYAANFRTGKIDVFDSNFQLVTSLPAGAFSDPHLPRGYAPFNVETLNGKIYVTYARQDAARHDPVSGMGRGIVDVFNLDGSPGLAGGKVGLVTGGVLNSPWGLALAPATFGRFAGDLMVGNFGNGRINIFDPNTGRFLSTVTDPDGAPIQIDGLWALRAGNGFAGTDTNTIYFTAGLDHEKHGLFGSLTAAAPGSPEGVAEAQAVVAALDIVQLDLATLTRDMGFGVSPAGIQQDLQILNADFASLSSAERHFQQDTTSDLAKGQLFARFARLPPDNQAFAGSSQAALTALFAELGSHSLGDPFGRLS